MDGAGEEKPPVEPGEMVSAPEGLIYTRAYASGLAAAMQGVPPIMAATEADQLEDVPSRLAYRLAYVTLIQGELPPMRGSM